MVFTWICLLFKRECVKIYIKENAKDKDYKKKYRKLPKCPLTYSGKGRERLIDVVEDFNEWAALHHVEEDELVSIWKVDIRISSKTYYCCK